MIDLGRVITRREVSDICSQSFVANSLLTHAQNLNEAGKPVTSTYPVPRTRGARLKILTFADRSKTIVSLG